jgi:transcriptional regulator with XRE-family HTH domain
MAANKRQAQLLSKAFDGASVQIHGETRDGTVAFSIHGLEGNWHLRAVWAGEGWPADVMRVLDELHTRPLPPDLVITARTFSPGAIELLTAHEANWADENGSARIRGQGLLLVRDAAPGHVEKPPFSWSPSALAVAETLLAGDWREGVSTGKLARLIDWSPPQVSQVLGAFDEKGWTVKYGPQRGPTARRELSDREGLLESWTHEVATGEREIRLAHRSMSSPLAFLSEELAEKLNEEVRWALSGWAAAHELAPYSSSVPSLQIYIHEEDFGGPLERAMRATGLADVAEGGRVAFIPAPASVLALSQQEGGLPLASSPRIYADLLSFGGRGADAADHFKEEVLDPRSQFGGAHDPPQGLVDWEHSCRRRLHDLLQGQHERNFYEPGAWSASYRLLDIENRPDARTLSGMLREIRKTEGRETGRPVWWSPDSGENRPRPVDGEIECWFRDMLPADPSHADYWRADPRGRLCLIRPYQEDWEYDLAPGTAFDLILPIWRTGECLLHAERMARRLEARTIQLMMRWTGLRSRQLKALEGRRRLGQTYLAERDEVVGYVQTIPNEIDQHLPELVQRLLAPLYESFDFFEPPGEVFEEQLETMRDRGNNP